MNHEQTYKQLVSLGFNVVKVTLQKISHKNGETWAFTNRAPAQTISVFGNSDVNCTLSILDLNNQEKSQSNIKDGKLVYAWLNDCDDVEVKMYADDFGKDALIIINDEGTGELVSYTQANELLIPKDVPTSSDSQTQHA